MIRKVEARQKALTMQMETALRIVRKKKGGRERKGSSQETNPRCSVYSCV